MPIIKSAKKRVKVAAKARARNGRTKRSLRDALKTFSKAVDSGKAADILKAQNEVVSAIDTAAKKNIIHKNRASRQKAALAARAKAAGVKPAKVTSQKPKAKSPAAAKKTAKTAAKKPAAKKTVSKK